MGNNLEQLNQIAATHLGKKGGEGYSDQYDPSLLVAVPRYLNRVDYGIKADALPFIGVDVWNAYEVSALTENGLPVAGQLKIVYSADSEFHVESKSIKLYLNSFNMTKLGKSRKEVAEKLAYTVKQDLSALLKTDVKTGVFVDWYGISSEHETISMPYRFYGQNLYGIISEDELESMSFDSYHSDANSLEGVKAEVSGFAGGLMKVYTDVLRSNCRVTNQPDHGTVFIVMLGSEELPTPTSLLKYIVSHRKVNHFHEEICEFIYNDLYTRFNPKSLGVMCLYARRGGIDINPIRVNDMSIMNYFDHLGISDIEQRMRKTPMQ